jgi:uncharacterized membrane protein/YHS domain-containing protein
MIPVGLHNKNHTMKRAKYILLLLALTVFPILGDANVDNTEAALRQGTCPVMEGNPVDSSLYVDYLGERVYFCCKTCVKLFSENPEPYISNLPQFTETASTEHGQEEEAHDHATDHGEGEPNRAVSFLGKFHPVAVHLPIALFSVAALAELLFLLTGAPLFHSAARFNLLIAVPASAISILLGLAAATGTDYPEDYARVFRLHRTLGFVSLGLGMVAALFSELAIKTKAGAVVKTYRAALLLSVVAVGVTGHLGGLLVYGLNHFSW